MATLCLAFLLQTNTACATDQIVRDAQALVRHNERVARQVARYPHTEIYNVSERRKVGINRIFEFDDTELGGRYPVILVPGRAEEFQPSAWWKKVHRLFQKHPDFTSNFKLYVYIYDSKQPLNFQADDFNLEMKQHFCQLAPKQQVILVTYSLGGMIAVNALRDQEVFNRIHAMFALAVPFHGSPMFDPDWFTKYLGSPYHSPVRTFWDRFIYRAYMFDKTNLTEGLKWNNFDDSMPQFDHSKLHLKGDQISHADLPYEEDAYVRALKKKTIVYASYLENGYTKSNQPLNPLKLPRFMLDKSTKLPKELVGVIMPFYGASVHSVFTYMNNQLANLPTFTPEFPEGRNTNLYRFNDGAIPLSSMIWLPKRATPYIDNFPDMIHATDVAKVRVFVNLDHMHIGDYDIHQRHLIAKDVVHPNDGKYTPRAWLLHDILNMLPSLEAGYAELTTAP